MSESSRATSSPRPLSFPLRTSDCERKTDNRSLKRGNDGKAGREGRDRHWCSAWWRAYAKRLAGLGAKVAIADLNLHSYEEFEAEAKDMTADSTVAEIEAAGGTALGIEVDVRDHEAVEAMAARVVEEWGRVDVLVANAGGGRGRPVDTKASTLDPALLQLVTAMNLFGTVYSCSAVAPIMKRQRSGKIITVSSVAGTGPSIDGGYAHYGAAKAAIAHYTRYLAQDLAPFGITANCIAPGVGFGDWTWRTAHLFRKAGTETCKLFAAQRRW
jgi:3-oxoacyl-[acyl-carrier protein] reductase